MNRPFSRNRSNDDVPPEQTAPTSSERPATGTTPAGTTPAGTAPAGTAPAGTAAATGAPSHAHRDGRAEHEERAVHDGSDREVTGHEEAHDKFGGVNIGALFFGWLVAIGVTILLAGIVTAAATAIDETSDLSVSLNEDADTIGLAAGIALLVVLFIGYYSGGYVAGRMSRFDGARQGVGVWVFGLLITIVAVALGALFGSEYNILDRIDLPRIPFSEDELTLGGIIAGLVILVATLVAAILGGIIGHRYHNRVDRVVRR